MDESWLAVAEAARDLAVSPQRVRSLLDAGDLAGRKLGGTWFVDPRAVEQRRTRDARPGRPLSAVNAWRVLRMLDPYAGGAGVAGEEVAVPSQVNAVDRSRLRALFADLPDPDGIAQRLAARAEFRRVRVHAGVVERLVADRAVSPGAGRAVAARGGGVADGGRIRLYLPARALPPLVDRYRLRDDVEGAVDLAVVPDGVSDELLPAAGQPVPLAVAWVDLLDDPDPRARGAARDWAAQLPRPLVVADGRRR